MKTFKYQWLAIAIVPVFMGCPKKPVKPPVADSELQSSVDATFATRVITDLDMICSFIGEDIPPKFYMAQPAATGTSVNFYNPATSSLFYAFNQTECRDGVMRDGTVDMDFANPDPNARHYRNFGFEGRMTLSEYKVDGWLVKTTNGVPCVVKNLVPAYNFNPGTTKLSWSIEGSFDFTHPTDPSRNMTWNGRLVKTLVNTASPQVYPPSGQAAIQWSLAVVEYEGTAHGITTGNVPFTIEYKKSAPLTRDFSCTPQKIGGIEATQPVLKTWAGEYHPFVKGVASFTTDSKYPREIYYGNEGSGLPQQCDNSGEVLIKGNSYRVDFL